MPCAVWYGNTVNGNYAIKDNVKYVYDEIGNIVKIYTNSEMSVRYAYDNLSRLVREDNKALGKTWLYAYDNNGNIISKREFNYTLRATELMEELESTDRIYSYFGDRLMGYGNETFEYDNIGNPLKYCGKTASWSKGRQLQSLGGTAFTYDAQGRRLSKGNITFTYDSEGRIIKQSNGLEFIYDNTGVVGVKYNGATYIYRKDAQGNIVALLDNTGVVVVRYEYDAWGNHGVEAVNSACSTLANLNPFRYRGYYYDTETELYYLQTRYYDPEVGRFITIDGIEYIDPETINGLNLYAYCGNNPVMGYDPVGTWDWNKFWKIFLGVTVGVVLAVVTVAAVVASGGALLVPVLTGFAIGAGSSLIGQGIGNLVSGKNFFDGISVGSVIMGGLAGAAFATGIGGLWGAVAIGAASNMGVAAIENKSWANIGLSAIVGGVASGLGYTAGKLISNTVFKNSDLGFKDFLELGKIDTGIIRSAFEAFRASYITLLPSITPGLSRGILKFLGNLGIKWL